MEPVNIFEKLRLVISSTDGSLDLGSYIYNQAITSRNTQCLSASLSYLSVNEDGIGNGNGNEKEVGERGVVKEEVKEGEVEELQSVSFVQEQEQEQDSEKDDCKKKDNLIDNNNF